MQYAYIYIYVVPQRFVSCGKHCFPICQAFRFRPVCLPLQCPEWRSLQDTMHSLQSMKMSTWFMPGFGTDGAATVGSGTFVVPFDPKTAQRSEWLLGEFGTSFSTQTGRGWNFSQKPTSGTKGAANGQCWNEMLPPLNLWCHNLIDLTAFYQVMSSWFKLRILMLMVKTTALGIEKDCPVIPNRACLSPWRVRNVYLFIWTPNNFQGFFCSPLPMRISCKRTKSFFENEKTQQFDVFEGPEPDARWRASWRSIGAAKPGFIVWNM